LEKHNIYEQKLNKMSAQTDMKVISVLLDEAMEHGLEVEVIYEALKTMREDDAITPAQAMQVAMDEWVK
jgi:predicted RNA methylase